MKRKEEIEHALTVLGRRMALDGAPDLEVLCCGASALCMLGLLSRSTMDVDVLGVVVQDRDLDPCEDFPEGMERAIANAGLELGLADDWFNGSASCLLKRGVPPSVQNSRRSLKDWVLRISRHPISNHEREVLKVNTLGSWPF